MVERVARAILAARHDELNGWDDLGGDEREQFIKEASAAIAAMREPTDMMGNGLPADYKPGSHSATQIWQAMIDAALKEETP